MPKRQAASATATVVAPPAKPTLEQAREAAASCQACDLWRRGTQTVFGEGGKTAEVMLVGEQPGDREDRTGRPFVGPAGAVLDQALVEASIDRRIAYVTNVVKHFKWVAKGNRRIHQSPDAAEVAACRPWLDTEIALIKPKIIVCLGAVAARALLGNQFRVSRQRGEFVPSPIAPSVIATYHPSAILRIPDEAARGAALEQFVADLKKVAQRLHCKENPTSEVRE